MANYSSHRFIMGKEEIDNFFCLLEIFGIFCLQKCLLSSPLRFLRLLSKSVNLIGCRLGKKGPCCRCWLSVRQKGLIFVKMFKNLLLRNHKGGEAETWHTCLGH